MITPRMPVSALDCNGCMVSKQSMFFVIGMMVGAGWKTWPGICARCWHRSPARRWWCRASQDEHATPQHAGDIAAGIPGAELWLLEGARHMLPQENAVEFNRALISCLKRAYV